MKDPAGNETPRSSRARSSLARYLAEIGEHPLLTREKESAIAKVDREALILSNLRFVVKIAAGYRGRGLPMEDLINEGNLGLIRAAERFDPALGNRFITYAAYWIRKALFQALSEQVSPVHIPRYQTLKARRRSQEEGPVAEGSTRDRSRPIVASLDEPVAGQGDRSPAEFLEDDAAENPERRVVRLDLLAKIEVLLDRLDERERAVIVGRFGLSGSESRTLQQIGSVYGLSRERIRQIEREVRGKLRDHLESAPRPFSRRKPRKKHCNPFADSGS